MEAPVNFVYVAVAIAAASGGVQALDTVQALEVFSSFKAAREFVDKQAPLSCMIAQREVRTS